MKLNLVADYEIVGKHTCHVFSIHSSNNLVGLADMTAIEYPARDGAWVRIEARTLQMCESRRKAQEVAKAWEMEYRKQGRLLGYTPITAAATESEVKA